MAEVVVTGIGCVSAVGSGASFYEGLLAGRDGISAITAFPTAGLERSRGGQVHDFQAHPAEASADRALQLAAFAARLAIADAGLTPAQLETAGVAAGTTTGESVALEDIVRRDGARAADAPDLWMRRHPYGLTRGVARALGAFGPTAMVPTACTAGNVALAFASDQIRLGTAQVMVAGAADPLSWTCFGGFYQLGAMAPQRCQPFARGRQGMLLGEGAGFLVLEEGAHARRRGARIYAKLLGYGMSCDASHMTAPQADGAGMAAAICAGLADAGVGLDGVDYVSAHGTGTEANDLAETSALKAVFGSGARRLWVSSIKSMLGHAMGAASALEAAACVLAIHRGVVPPTMNYDEPDPALDLDYVPNQARAGRVRVAVNNSAAFGGNNAVVVFGAFA